MIINHNLKLIKTSPEVLIRNLTSETISEKNIKSLNVAQFTLYSLEHVLHGTYSTFEFPSSLTALAVVSKQNPSGLRLRLNDVVCSRHDKHRPAKKEEAN